MKKYWDKFVDDIAPNIFGVMLLIAAVMLSFGAAVWSIKWVLSLLGVIG